MEKILLIDDEKEVRELWKRLHEVAEPTFKGRLEMDCACDLEQGLARLRGTKYDAVILDLTLPPLRKEEVLSWLAEHHEELPVVIVMTGTDDIWTLRRCAMSGAAQFFSKTDAIACPNLFFKILYFEYLKRYGTKETPLSSEPTVQ